MVTTYIDEPSGIVMLEREDCGHCLVCGAQARGCWCRFCAGCSRFWQALTAAPRNPDPDAPNYGIKAEDCLDCRTEGHA